MLVRRLSECPEFLAGDATRLRELLHPDKQSVAVPYSVAHGYVEAGGRSLRHRLSTSEVYYFIGGRGRAGIGSSVVSVERGTLLYVPPHTEQWVESSGDERLEFLCLVEPAWTPACEEILEHGERATDTDARGRAS
jgi:mannose-6-phosphate isomerase-like protein (cupin superfamily)